MAEQRLEGKVCVVTGGGQGIGRGIAMRMAAEGAKVCIADINEDNAKNTASEIGGNAVGCRCDVADRTSVKAMVRSTVDAFGRLNVIFNNAAVAEIKPFMEVTESDWERLMRVNALGVMICMQEAARQMIDQGEGGKIINTASIAGKEGYEIQPHYCASKFSVVALTQAGARAFAENGICVNAFCPGVVQTTLWDQLDKEFLDHGLFEQPGDAMAEFGRRILLGRPSTPNDIAGLATFLASDDSNYITGQSIMVDGGMVLL